MPDGLVTPQVPATQVVFGTLQLGQLVLPLPAVQLAVVVLLLDEDTLLDAAALLATELLADEALLELETATLEAEDALLPEDDTAAALELDEALLELATLALLAALEEALLELEDTALLELALLLAVGIEHSFTPPVMRPPKVALLQTKLPDSVR
ncbi:hypothetical protein ACFONG_12185 [Uliginosibacterium paludis]|uniref:Uncharacterized protein n=1 Tax=Uliginosibacterium paludis TaxID=1615952 RepID=A0ABV2CQF7_9RHOO